MGMDIDKSRHDDRLCQTDDAMTGICLQNGCCLADSVDPSMFYDDGPGSKGGLVNPSNYPVSLDDHLPHTVP